MAQVGTGACYISQMSEYVPQRQQSCGAAVSLPVAETRLQKGGGDAGGCNSNSCFVHYCRRVGGMQEVVIATPVLYTPAEGWGGDTGGCNSTSCIVHSCRRVGEMQEVVIAAPVLYTPAEGGGGCRRL